MHPSPFTTLIALSSVVALGLIVLLIRLRGGWRVLVALALAGVMGVGGFFGWKLQQSQKQRARALNEYYAGLDEIARGDINAGKRRLEQAIRTDPGVPGAKGKLRQLGTAQKVAERAKPLDLKPPPGSGPGRRPSHPYHRPSDIQIDNYDLRLTVDPERRALAGIAFVTISARRDTPTADFELAPIFRVRETTVGPQKMAFRRVNNLLSINDALRKGDRRVYRIVYQLAEPQTVLTNASYLSPEGSYLLMFSSVFPTNGTFDFYCPVSVRITMPSGYQAVSIGRLVGKETSGKITTFIWQSLQPITMVNVAVARYRIQTGVAGKTSIATYLFAHEAKLGGAYLNQMRKIIGFYTRLYGPYPYEKLAVAEIPFFPGGIGTTSLVMLTQRSFDPSRLPTEFVSHELAHQWWGNAVFPKGPGLAWLSEPFAVYSSYLYNDEIAKVKPLRKSIADALAQYLGQARAMGEEPIALTDPYDQTGAYYGTIYYRGACVLHMLRWVMGDKAFFSTLRDFVAQNKGHRVAIDDFRRACEVKYGRPLDWFFDEWLNHTGIMKTAYNYSMREQGNGASLVDLTIRQEGMPYRMPIDIILHTQSSQTRRVVWVTAKENRYTFAVDGPVTSVDFDPDGWLMMLTPRMTLASR